MEKRNKKLLSGDSVVLMNGKPYFSESGAFYGEDGISLASISHPKPSLWQRFLSLFRRKDINPDSLETIEIEIDDDINYSSFYPTDHHD